jgi:hypothetical protein
VVKKPYVLWYLGTRNNWVLKSFNTRWEAHLYRFFSLNMANTIVVPRGTRPEANRRVADDGM